MVEFEQTRPEAINWNRYEGELGESGFIDRAYEEFQAENAARTAEARASVREALQPARQETQSEREAKGQWLGQATTRIAYLRDDVRGLHAGQ